MKSQRLKAFCLFLLAVALSAAIVYIFWAVPGHLEFDEGIDRDGQRDEAAVWMGLVVIGLVIEAVKAWRQTK